MADHVISYQTYVGAAPEKVWAAIVAPDGLWKAWYGAWIESGFRPGDRIEYLGPGADGERTVHIYGQIETCEAPKILSYIEHPGPAYRPNHANEHFRTTYRLEPAGPSTKLTIVVDQWSKDHYYLPKADEAWCTLACVLKSFVETGTILNLG